MVGGALVIVVGKKATIKTIDERPRIGRMISKSSLCVSHYEKTTVSRPRWVIGWSGPFLCFQSANDRCGYSVRVPCSGNVEGMSVAKESAETMGAFAEGKSTADLS